MRAENCKLLSILPFPSAEERLVSRQAAALGAEHVPAIQDSHLHILYLQIANYKQIRGVFGSSILFDICTKLAENFQHYLECLRINPIKISKYHRISGIAVVALVDSSSKIDLLTEIIDDGDLSNIADIGSGWLSAAEKVQPINHIPIVAKVRLVRDQYADGNSEHILDTVLDAIEDANKSIDIDEYRQQKKISDDRKRIAEPKSIYEWDVASHSLKNILNGNYLVTTSSVSRISDIERPGGLNEYLECQIVDHCDSGPSEFLPGVRQGLLRKFGFAEVLERESIASCLDLVRKNIDGGQAVCAVISPQTLEQTSFWRRTIDYLALDEKLARRLILAISSPVALPPVAGFNRSLAALRELGCRLALDHFGHGGASIDVAMALRPEVLILDRGLLWRAASSGAQLTLLNHVTALARTLAPNVVIRGIETSEHLQLARRAGATHGQGRYFGSDDRMDMS